MRTQHLLVTLAVAVGVAACGSSGDGGPTFASKADSATISLLADQSNQIISSTFSSTFKNGDPSIPLPAASIAGGSKSDVAVAYFQRIARMVGNDRGIILPMPSAAPHFASPFSECNPTITGVDTLGDPIDSDGDNIPDDYKINFGSACVSEDSAGTHRETISGFIEFQDVGAGFYTFRVTVGHLKLVENDLTTGAISTFTINGTESFDATTSLASHALSFALGETEHTTGNPDVTFTISDAESSTFDPDNGLSLSLGNPLPNGVLDMNVDLKLTGFTDASAQTGNFRMVLDTPTPVHYNTACGTEIDAGQLRGLLNGQATVGFTATWSSCADPVVVIFGGTPAAVAAR